MKKIKISSLLNVDAESLSYDVFKMNGINYELNPLAHMTSPKHWRGKKLQNWPTEKTLFTSIILLFLIVPVDLHFFKLRSVQSFRFQEESSSLFNNIWRHSRNIEPFGSCSKITDVVEYQSKFQLVERLVLPIYRSIFNHRHYKLMKRYGTAS